MELDRRLGGPGIVGQDRGGHGDDTRDPRSNRTRGLVLFGRSSGDDGRLQTTPAALALLAELTLYNSATRAAAHERNRADGRSEEVSPPALEPDVLDGLVDEVSSAAVDSGHADRFEGAVRDSFVYLGFQAEWLGGSGKTDVLLAARLGLTDSYRVVVDCKTSGSGSVGDAQVDWVTLTEHRAKHDAQHIAVVAPNPTGTRLFERARQYAVTVISVDELLGLCRQLAKAPLGLDDYRSLFIHGGRDATPSSAASAASSVHRAVVTRFVKLAVRYEATLYITASTNGYDQLRDTG